MALTTAFARNGNRKAVPQTTADGSVSYDQGFGNLYALPPEEGGLFIDRAQFNQIMYDTTSAVISNQNSINTLNSKVTANTNSINTLNGKVADLESGVSTGVVNLTGNQTINGVKTFSAPPISATNPTANNQVANKAYVDTVGNTAVKLTGNQTIAGTKTFSSPVVVPNATANTHAVNLAQLNTKANANATVNLTGDQSIAGAKTFNSNITAPNITTMQNSINTLNGKFATLADGNTVTITLGTSESGAQFQTLDAALAEAKKYFGNKRIVIKLLGDISINKAYQVNGSLYNNIGFTSEGSNKTINFGANGSIQFVECSFALRNINFTTTSPNKNLVGVLNATGVIIRCNFDGAAKAIVNRASLVMIEFCSFTNISTTCIDNYRNGITDLVSSTINNNVSSLIFQTRGGIVHIDYTTINTPVTTSKYNIAANTLTEQGIIFDNDQQS